MPALTFHPLTPDRWDDLERLFGPERGADSGCWCMFWRLRRSEFHALGKQKRKAAFRELVKSNAPLGILAYEGAQPVGWCAIAPRAATPGLERSPVCKPVDDRPAWSITCFFVEPKARRDGVMAALIDAAVKHAKRHGARIVEAYPRDPGRARIDSASGYVGLLEPFAAEGFQEVARRTPKRPFMRRYL
ncbi:MAG TPA: GNAT family N-acetyltransferase [Candidatus Acidoferrum sp.]|nr:GNAT family N-acetyltransferase [Candidatus Acidoferrum sp.]